MTETHVSDSTEQELEQLRKQNAELKQQLRSKQEVLELAISHAPVVISAFDKRGVILLSVGKGLENLGRRPGDNVGKLVTDIYGHIPGVMSGIEKALAGESATYLIPVGNTFFHVWLLPHLSEDGEVEVVFSVALDVTERCRIEAQLKAAEARYRQILNSISDLVLVRGADSRIVWGNRSLAEFYGTTEAELSGKIDSFFSDPDQTQQSLRDDAYVFRTGQKLEIPEETMTRFDGDVRIFQTVKSPIVDADGNVVMSVAVSRDITDRKQFEQRLVLSQRMASLGTLAAGVSHEINNPMAYLAANLEFALVELQRDAEALTPETISSILEALQDAVHGASRVARVVKDMRAFSKVSNEHFAPVSVQSILESALNMVWNELRQRARIVRQYGDVPLVLGNEPRLGQVFINLLMNASQSIAEGHPERNEIRISTHQDSKGNAIIEVKDTGCGIAPQTLPHIFDPFYSTKPVGEGTGLGLFICHGIVTSMNGSIEVESESGVGTTFRIVLPAASPHVSPPMRQVLETSSEQTERRRVLVVDDDAMVGRAVHRMLGKTHEVVLRTSARSALEDLAAGTLTFDLILCDLMMPEVTGIEFYEELQRIDIQQCEKVMFTTGGAFTPTAQQFLENTPRPILEKPFSRSDLLAILNRGSDGREAR